MAESYQPACYWHARLQQHFSLRGVGHLGFSESYNQWLYRRKARTLERVWGDTNLRGRRLLDIGPGVGFFVEWYRARGCHVTGLDIAPISIERLRARWPDSDFELGDVSESRPGWERAFDVINVWDVLYHIVDDARFAAALANMAGWAAEGARLLVSDALAGASVVTPAPHVAFRPLTSYQAVLPAAGMHLVQLLPLYRRLNDPRHPTAEARAAEFFKADDADEVMSHENLCVGVWRREQTGGAA